MRQAREGNGPGLIEAVTYRMGPHTTSDDPTRYRSAALDDEWKQKDPIDRVRRLLDRQGLLDDALITRVQERADTTAAELRRGCLETVEPGPMSLFDHVYADAHPLVDEERRTFAAYLAGFEGTQR
jgi:pyruvate dehydrogenase E1 component alpha subunit